MFLDYDKSAPKRVHNRFSDTCATVQPVDERTDGRYNAVYLQLYALRQLFEQRAYMLPSVMTDARIILYNIIQRGIKN